MAVGTREFLLIADDDAEARGSTWFLGVVLTGGARFEPWRGYNTLAQ